MNGRLLPFGWWHFLRRGKIMDRVRVGFLGVKPEYQHTGVAAGLFVEHFDMAGQHPPDLGRGGLDPRDQRRHEPRHGGDGRPGRQALPRLRAVAGLDSAACPSPSPPRARSWPRSGPLPVLAEPPEARVLDRPPPPPLPVVVAVGTVGFMAGVLAWTLVRVLRRPRSSSAVRALGRRRRRGIEVAGTRSFLVDVHLLKR